MTEPGTPIHLSVTDRREAEPDQAIFRTTQLYEQACRLATQGHTDEARKALEVIRLATTDGRLQAKVENDLAVLAALRGDIEAARTGFQDVLLLDPDFDICARTWQFSLRPRLPLSQPCPSPSRHRQPQRRSR